MSKFYCLLLLCPAVAMAAPQVIGFGDASPDEIAQIRAGTYGETFDENPQYNFNYKVADSDEQTYIAMNENRDGDQVTGSYQYVDPLGSLIIVTYTAGVMGYSETREVQPNYVDIKPRPVKQQTTTSSFVGSSGSNSGFSSSGSNSGFSSSNSGFGGSSSGFGSSSFGSSSNFGSSSSNNFGSSGSSSFNADSIVNAVVSQVQPLISSTVSNAVGGGSRRPVAVLSTPPPLAAAPAPITTSFNSNDIVSQVVSNIQPLISSTVSNAVGSSSGRFNSRTSSASNSASNSASFSPAPIAAPRRPAPAVSSSSSINDLFGNGDTFNVRFNTPDFEIQY